MPTKISLSENGQADFDPIGFGMLGNCDSCLSIDLRVLTNHKVVLINQNINGVVDPVPLDGISKLIKNKPGTAGCGNEQFHDLRRAAIEQNIIIHISVNGSLNDFSSLFQLPIPGNRPQDHKQRTTTYQRKR